MRWALAAGASLALFCIAARSTFVPLRDETGVEYLFVWPGGAQVLGVSAGAVLIVLAGFALVVRVTRRAAPDNLAEARTGRWIAPLAAIGLLTGGLAPAVPGVGDRAAMLGYFLYDLRWWWTAVLAALVAARADRIAGEPIGRRIRAVARWSPAARLLLFDAALFVIVTAWAAITTPPLRFNADLHGDEPKYIRYCEAWYQGTGSDLSRKALMADLPLDAPSAVLANGALLAGAIRDNARALAGDLAGFAADPRDFRWNRAHGSGGFLTGRHGGIYQLHQPGLSAILFSGYFIDRHLLGLQPGYQNEFPSSLVMTSLTMLTLYGFGAVALFRLLRHAFNADGLAWVAAAVAMLSLPAAAFAFQYYPETVAALVVAAVGSHVLFRARRVEDPPPVSAVLAGAAAGALPWLHPRFLLVSLALGSFGVIGSHGRARCFFAAGYALGLFSVLAFIYNVTGSWLPTAMYDASEGDVALVPSAVAGNLASYAVHGTWGLVPHSPWLLGVLPGIVVLARRAPRHAAFVVAVALALAIPAAGHGLIAAGGTPGRMLMAIVPLLVWPAAALVARFRSSAALRSGVVIATVVSLDAALSYNWSHVKDYGPMRDASPSGWKPNLAFPEVRGWEPGHPDFVLFLCVFGILAAVSLLAWARSRRESPPPQPPRIPGLVPAGVFLLVVLLSTTATAARGRWTRGDYLPDERAARTRAAEALVRFGRCRVCFTSRRRQVDWTWLQPNPARDPRVETFITGRRVTVRVDLGAGGFGRVRVEFGDGTVTEWAGVVSSLDVAHHYWQAGEYRLAVWLQLREGQWGDRRSITVPER